MDYKKHTKDRFLQRMGKSLSDDEYNMFSEWIKTPGLEHIIKSKNFQRKLFKYNDQLIWLCFNRKGTIKTMFIERKLRIKHYL